MSASIEELEARVARIEVILGEVAPETAAGQYLAVIDKLVAEEPGLTHFEAAERFNRLLLSDEVQAEVAKNRP